MIAVIVQYAFKVARYLRREFEVGRALAQADVQALPDGFGGCGVPADDHEGECGGMDCTESAWSRVFGEDDDDWDDA